jgi:hypothetical protein
VHQGPVLLGFGQFVATFLLQKELRNVYGRLRGGFLSRVVVPLIRFFLYLIVVSGNSLLALSFALPILIYIWQQNGRVLLFSVSPAQVLLLHLVRIDLAQILHQILLLPYPLLLPPIHRCHISVNLISPQRVLSLRGTQIQRLLVHHTSCHTLLLDGDVDHGWSLEFHP